jgi:hypothetical protein
MFNLTALSNDLESVNLNIELETAYLKRVTAGWNGKDYQGIFEGYLISWENATRESEERLQELNEKRDSLLVDLSEFREYFNE